MLSPVNLWELKLNVFSYPRINKTLEMSKKCFINVHIKRFQKEPINLQFLYSENEDLKEFFMESFANALEELKLDHENGRTTSYVVNDTKYNIVNFQNFKVAVLSHLDKELQITIDYTPETRLALEKAACLK